MAKLYNTDWREHKDALNDDNIPSNSIDCTYHILYGPLAHTKGDQLLESVIPIEISLFNSGNDSMIEEMDKILNDAHCFAISMLDVKQYNIENISDVVLNSITPDPLDESNDNTIQVRVQLDFKMYHDYL